MRVRKIFGWLLCTLFAVAIAFAVAACTAATPAPASRDALDEGLRLYSEANYEAARVELLKSAASDDSEVRSESFLYLNALEMELGHWDAARPWLEKYHAEITRQSVERAVAQVNRRHNRIFGAIAAAALIAVGIFFRRTKKKKISPLKYEGFLSEADDFKKTDIYKEIAELAAQTERGRDARVLSLSRQEALDAELETTFGGFAEKLRADFPALTAGDVKLCCLSLAGLSTFARALCFGSTETNIVKQRKHKLKAKLSDELFEFIFS